MVRRRNVLVGAAGVLGTVAVGAGLVDVVGGPGRALANESALARAPAAGFPLPGSLLCPVPYLSRAGWGADESWRLVNGAESGRWSTTRCRRSPCTTPASRPTPIRP